MDPMDDIQEWITRSELAARQVVRIRATHDAEEGVVTQRKVDGDERENYIRRGIKDPREIVIHPNDWKVLKQAFRAKLKPTPRLSGVTFLSGIPVLEEYDEDEY